MTALEQAQRELTEMETVIFEMKFAANAKRAEIERLKVVVQYSGYAVIWNDGSATHCSNSIYATAVAETYGRANRICRMAEVPDGYSLPVKVPVREDDVMKIVLAAMRDVYPKEPHNGATESRITYTDQSLRPLAWCWARRQNERNRHTLRRVG